MLILALFCALLPAAAEELTDFSCTEMQFTTKVPAGAIPRYEEGNGLRIYTKAEGSIPYVAVYRRPLENKFKNPTDYLNNVFPGSTVTPDREPGVFRISLSPAARKALKEFRSPSARRCTRCSWRSASPGRPST